MINGRLISKILGLLLLVESLFLVFSAGVSLCYGEDDLEAFLYAALINAICGSLAWVIGWNAEKKFTPRDGYFVVTVTWILCSLAGMLPFYIGGYVPTVADGYFECMSGFTSTGFTVMNDIDSLPHGILFWRAFTQWIGGLGIVFFTIAVLPFLGVTGVQLFAAEATGPTKDKLHPRIGVTARWIWGLYLGLTLAETLLLMLGGMSFFDSICHSFSTTATGGFSTHQANIAYYHSPYIEYVISTFMFLSGVNFITLFLFLKGKHKKLLQHDEFKWYLNSTIICVLFTSVLLYFSSDRTMEDAFRKALFQITSVHTSTGFTTENFALWPTPIWAVLLFLMISGASSGSTSGGVKCVRLSILLRTVRNEFRRIVHPNAVLPVRINKHPLSSNVLVTSLILILLFGVIAALCTYLIMEMNVSFIGAVSFVLSCMGNTGVGLGEFGPAYTCSSLSETGKWLGSFLMLLGRLELFTVLLLFTPQFWNKR